MMKLLEFCDYQSQNQNIKMHQINLDEINIEVVLKNIKNLHLTILSPLGKVRISAPKRMKLENIKMFALTKLSWIKKQQAKMLSQEREAKKAYKNNEEHHFLGEKYLLEVVQTSKKPSLEVVDGHIILNIKNHFGEAEKKHLLQNWYRKQLTEIVWQLIAKWEKTMNLQIAELQIRQMKTRWGSCHIGKKKIIINLELAKKPLHCLEYVVVHEMVHLFERKHNQRFKNYMTHYLPNWQACKQQLNSLLV